MKDINKLFLIFAHEKRVFYNVRIQIEFEASFLKHIPFYNVFFYKTIVD